MNHPYITQPVIWTGWSKISCSHAVVIKASHGTTANTKRQAVIRHYAHQSKNKVSRDTMTPLWQEHDTSPRIWSELKYQLTKRSIMFKSSDWAADEWESFDLWSPVILAFMFKAFVLAVHTPTTNFIVQNHFDCGFEDIWLSSAQQRTKNFSKIRKAWCCCSFHQTRLLFRPQSWIHFCNWMGWTRIESAYAANRLNFQNCKRFNSFLRFNIHLIW